MIPRSDDSSDTAGAAAPLRTEAVRGPVKVTVEVSPAKPRLSDDVALTLTIEVDDGVACELPPFGDSIGGMIVRSYRTPLPEVQPGKRVLRQHYVLEPADTGAHLIRPITVTFTDGRPGGDGLSHQVETDPLTVEVSSLLGAEAPSLAALKPMHAAERLPEPVLPPWPILAAIGGGLALAAGLALLLLRRRRRAAPVRVPTPAELAEAELEALVAADPLARGELNTFFSELTLIVRRFIERTTGLNAPEQTTEEFLRAMRAHPAFAATERERLQAFLMSADLVKFAAVAPPRGEIEESFRRAQEFAGLPGTIALAPAGAGGPR